MEELRLTFESERFGQVELDFSEVCSPDAESFFQEDRLTRPEKPMSFRLGLHTVEVHYRKGLYPQLLCNCSAEAPCAHILALEEEVFPQILSQIFEQCGGQYNKAYLRHEIAQRIRMIAPRSEAEILAKIFPTLREKRRCSTSPSDRPS